MSIKVPKGLPALQKVMNEGFSVEILEASTEKTLHIALLNLMPMKETTEADFIRILSGTSHEIELTLMSLDTHTPKHASPAHMQQYYKPFSQLRDKKFDGFIITGAPIEKIEFEEVTYWNELCSIIEWTNRNVTSTLFICWAAQAGLYYKFGIQKYLLPKKMFGIFNHKVLTPEHPLFRGIGTSFNVPQSRHTGLHEEDIINEQRIELLATSALSGVHIVQERCTNNFFITGHSEYETYTLDNEYKRDIAKGDAIELPLNYYTGNNPELPPVNSWHNAGKQLFDNWLRFYATDSRKRG
jgi:homoserine O-succinyltransferase